MRSTRVVGAVAAATKVPLPNQTAQPALVETLENVFRGPARRSDRGHKKPRTPGLTVAKTESAIRNYRNEVVSRSLCDDTINYLAPTLEKHKGCVIVDFNPGACLWSSRLHDFLKPKRHVLMEPEARYFEPFIKPLLDQPGSTYRYTPLAGYNSLDIYKNYDEVMNDQDLFPVMPVDPDDPQRQKPNPGVLFVGNLARLGKSVPRRVGSLCNLSLMRFTGAMVSNQLIHRDGLARMLFWVPESDKSNLFAYNEGSKTKLSVAMGLSSQMTEAVGVTPLIGSIQKFADLRGPGLEDVEHRRVQASMQDLKMQPTRDILKNYVYSSEQFTGKQGAYGDDIETQGATSDETPPAAASVVIVEDSKINPTSKIRTRKKKPVSTRVEEPLDVPNPKDFASPWDKPLKTIEEFKTYLTDIKSRVEFLLTISTSASVGAPLRSDMTLQDAKVQKLVQEIEFPQCYDLAERASYRVQGQPIRLRAAVRWDTCLRVHKLEMFLQELWEKGLISKKYYHTTKCQIIELGVQTDALIKKMLTTHIGGTSSRYKNIIDHQISFFSRPPGLPRDRRLYEPLKASEGEFWPPAKLMLLDFQPREINFLVKDLVTQAEQHTIISQLLTQLLHATATPVGKAMDQIAPNMAEDLIPLCPSMSDPRKGGRLDAANMRVGMLTEDMIRELIVAFVEWPFRPSTVALELGAIGSASFTSEEDAVPME
nr:hypothetical protein CFP56_19210 [Quercus suber]